jgi:hypothetical protein
VVGCPLSDRGSPVGRCGKLHNIGRSPLYRALVRLAAVINSTPLRSNNGNPLARRDNSLLAWLGKWAVLAGILVFLVAPVVAYTAAHQNAQAFMAEHPELEGVSFYVVDVPLNSGGTGHLIIDSRNRPAHAGTLRARVQQTGRPGDERARRGAQDPFWRVLVSPEFGRFVRKVSRTQAGSQYFHDINHDNIPGQT